MRLVCFIIHYKTQIVKKVFIIISFKFHLGSHFTYKYAPKIIFVGTISRSMADPVPAIPGVSCSQTLSHQRPPEGGTREKWVWLCRPLLSVSTELSRSFQRLASAHCPLILLHRGVSVGVSERERDYVVLLYRGHKFLYISQQRTLNNHHT